MKFSQIVIIVSGVALLGGLLFALKPKNEVITPSSATPIVTQDEIKKIATPESSQSFELQIKDKKLVSGSATLQVTQGDTVTIKIISDEKEELHLHVYDRSVELEPGVQAVLTFNADLAGRFPFELENSQIEIGVLEVQPK